MSLSFGKIPLFLSFWLILFYCFIFLRLVGFIDWRNWLARMLAGGDWMSCLRWCEWIRCLGDVTGQHDLKPGSHCAFFFKSPLGLYLSDCKNIMIMSHYGISVVINVRLYDSQDALKTGKRKKTCPVFYIINPYTFSDWELRCMPVWNVGYHEI